MAEQRPSDEPAEGHPADLDGVSGGGPVEEHLDEQEDESFPASDPHSDWAGPAT